MKRLISAALALLLAFSMAALTGCAPKQDTLTVGEWLSMVNDEFGMYSYDEEDEPYIEGMSPGDPYYEAAQIAGAWGTIPQGSDLDLSAPLTNEFAAASLAKTVGREDFAGMSDKEIAQYSAENGYLAYDYRGANRTVSLEDAVASIETAKDVWTQPVSTPSRQVTYAEGVVPLPENATMTAAFSYDDTANAVTLPEAAARQVKPGDVYLLFNLPPFGESQAFRAQTVNTANGVTTVVNSSAQPQMHEIFDELHIAASPEVDFTNVGYIDGAGNVQPYNPLAAAPRIGEQSTFNGAPAVQPLKTITMDGFKDNGMAGKKEIKLPNGWDVEYDLSKTSASFTIKKGKIPEMDMALSIDSNGNLYSGGPEGGFSGEAYAGYTISIFDICPTVKIDYKTLGEGKTGLITGWSLDTGIPTRVDYAYACLSYKVSEEFKAGAKIAEEFLIMSVPIPVDAVFGGLLATLWVEIKMIITIEGEISLTASLSDYKVGFERNGGSTREISEKHKSEPELKINASLELTPYIGLRLSIVCDLLAGEAGLAAGIGIEAETSNLLDPPICVDASLYWVVKLKFGVSAGFGALSESKEISICNKNNAKIKDYHFEDWAIVSYYEGDTYHRNCCRDKEEEQETTADPNGPTNAPDPYEPFTGERRLQLDSYMMFLNVGKSDTMRVTLPAGYSPSDLVWASSSTSVASVSNGAVSGKAEGEAEITVKTSDGKYGNSFTVIVRAPDVWYDPNQAADRTAYAYI